MFSLNIFKTSCFDIVFNVSLDFPNSVLIERVVSYRPEEIFNGNPRICFSKI